VSSPHLHIPPLPVRERAACMCAEGGSCSSYAPGHALHLIQARLSSATPTEWLDAVIESVDAERGDVVLRPLDGSAPIVLWNGAGAASRAVVGTPVALHARYDVLAIGRERFNCARV